MELNPIQAWLDEESGLVIPKKNIFAGIPFHHIRNFKGNFEKTDIYYFWKTYLIPEIFSLTKVNTSLDPQIELENLRKENEKTKQELEKLNQEIKSLKELENIYIKFFSDLNNYFSSPEKGRQKIKQEESYDKRNII